MQQLYQQLKEFYEGYGWEGYIHEDPIKKNYKAEGNIERYDIEFPIKLVKPKVLLEIAKDKLNYNLDKLCF